MKFHYARLWHFSFNFLQFLYLLFKQISDQIRKFSWLKKMTRQPSQTISKHGGEWVTGWCKDRDDDGVDDQDDEQVDAEIWRLIHRIDLPTIAKYFRIYKNETRRRSFMVPLRLVGHWPRWSSRRTENHPAIIRVIGVSIKPYRQTRANNPVR